MSPELFETIALPKGGIECLPPPTAPYYVIAKEGPYLYKPTEIGNALLREHVTPKSLPEVGNQHGVFTWKGDPIPGHIVSAAHDFFRRIYNKHHTEAEVLITKNFDTDGYRLFVPYQRTSHAGVKSIYEPTHIDRRYAVVGTLHSHCDFSAFHSSTDSGDASDMDGVHFTIGYVNRETPEIVSMVAMGGIEFHYKEPSDIAQIEYNEASAPEWWDAYVFANNDAPRQKPKGFVSLTQEHWDEFLGRALVKPKVQPTTKWKPTEYRATTPQYNWLPAGDRSLSPTDHWKDWRPSAKATSRMAKDPQINNALDFAEDCGLLSEDDWDFIKAESVDSLTYWQAYFIDRHDNLVELLAMLDVTPTGRNKRRMKRTAK